MTCAEKRKSLGFDVALMGTLAMNWDVQEHENPSPLPCVCMLVTQSCLTHCNPMDFSQPDSSVRGIFQVPTGVGGHASLKGIFPTTYGTCVSCITGRFFTVWATRWIWGQDNHSVLFTRQNYPRGQAPCSGLLPEITSLHDLSSSWSCFLHTMISFPQETSPTFFINRLWISLQLKLKKKHQIVAHESLSQVLVTLVYGIACLSFLAKM